MPGPSFSAADFAQALRALMPRGRVWPAEAEAVQSLVLAGLARGFARLTGDAQALLVDAFPATAVQLLTEWEEALGLPDPCAGEAPTLQQRQRQVTARLTDSGGQSAAYFVGLAAALGYQVTVESYAPFRVGTSTVGQSVGGDAWSHAWSVTAPLNSVTPFAAGMSAADEPLNVWGNAVLECELRARAPGHTILIFRYA